MAASRSGLVSGVVPWIGAALLALAACAGPDGTGDAADNGAPHPEDVPRAEAGGGDVHVPGTDTPWTGDVAENPVKITTTLEPDTVLAGEWTTPICKGYDAAGNPMSPGPVSLDVPAEVSLSGFQVSATMAGVYRITCRGTAGQEAEEVGADLTVLPGQAETFSLKLVPAKDYFKPGDTVSISGVGEDGYGNPLKDLPLMSVGILPASLATVDGNTMTFQVEGIGTIRAFYAMNTGLSDEVAVVVDAAGPVIQVTSPPRAASLHTSMDLRVKGSIKDPGGVVSATLNGAPLTLGPGGVFDEPLPTKHGLNMIEIEAEDVVGRTARHLQSFFLTNKYYPVPEGLSSLAFVPSGVLVWLDQDAFVGASGPDFASLSHLVQEFLLAFDLAALIPSPAAGQSIAWCNYDIYLSNLSYDSPQIELWPAVGGLDIHISVPNLSGDIWAPAPELACPDMEGKMTANAVTIEAFAAISLPPSGDLQVSLEEIEVEFVGLSLDLYGIIGELVQAMLWFFLSDMTEMIEAEFEAQLKSQIESQLETLLGQVNIDASFAVPPFMPGAPGATISAHFRPAQVKTGAWGVEYTMDAAFSTPDPTGLEAPGPAARSGCMAGPPSVATTEEVHPIEVALHDDVLNQIVFAVWRDGGTNTVLDADTMAAMGTDPSEMGVDDLSLETTALLPPFISDCHPDGALRIYIGDMRMDVSASVLGIPLEMVLYLYFSAKLDILVTGQPGDQTVEIQYGEMDWAEMHVGSLNEEWEGQETLFGMMVEETFMPAFLEGLQSFPYGFNVSEIPIHELLPVFDGEFVLVPVLDAFERRTGYSLIKAHLVVE